ncbi:MAG: hypothetical protein Kow0098_25900 [Ignavibacteriaceae bacterium]
MKRIILLTLLYIPLYAQQYDLSAIDSMVSKYIAMHSSVPEIQTPPGEIADYSGFKCGFLPAAGLKLNFEFLSKEQQEMLAVYLTRPQLDTSFVSPSGFFRIHFDIAGQNAPAFDINLFAEALDSVYRFEVDFLGFPPPPPDQAAGGDDLYDFYILDTPGLYGETITESFLGDNKFTSFIKIDNDFSGNQYYTHGIDAAKVTAAHEFHHAIQVGNYKISNTSYSQDGYFYEMTSTSMEEFVFDEVNDYYGYMSSYFNNPQNPFASNNGYNLAIWNLFLRQRFDFDIIKRQWSIFAGDKRALEAIHTSLIEHSSTFGHELNQFAIWNYFTGYRKIENLFFEEGRFYPLIKVTNLNFGYPYTEIKMNAFPTSNNYIVFTNSSPIDTIVAIITQTNYISGIDSLSRFYNFTYILYGDSLNGTKKLISNYSSTIQADNLYDWAQAEIVNGNIISDSLIIPPDFEPLEFAYPGPFRYSTHSEITIPVNSVNTTSVTLNIYSSSMDLIFDRTLDVEFDLKGNRVVKWNVRDNKGSKVASGVYIYVVKTGDETDLGKLVIFNE